jgi:glycine betaine/proline transport system substrate-binding protein
MSYALAVDKQDPEEFAKQWVEGNASVVDSWFQ